MDMSAPRIDIPDLVKFFAFAGEQELVDPLSMIEPSFETETKSKGKYERADRIDARITARVLEVKPNGQLVLEAKSVIGTDDESQTFLLSGVCRQEDVTARNTVLSSQLFDLRIDVKNEGEIRQAMLTRQFTALETALSQMNSQSSWLASQIASLPTYSSD